MAPAVPLPAPGRQSFTYHVPAGAESIGLGSVVRIPFGKRRVTGIITRLHQKAPSFPTKLLQPAANLTLTRQQISFAKWISATLKGGLGYTLRLFLPPRLAKPPAPLSAQWRGRASAKQSVPPASRFALVDSRSVERQATVRRLITNTLREKNAQVLVLVPEKSLLEKWSPWPTLHAGLPPRQLASVWRGVAEGKLRVVISTQKALFLPFRNLCLIIIEESQLATHKLWDQYPRLDSRDAAEALAKIHGASILYSASFPSVGITAGLASGSLQSFIPAHLKDMKPEVHTFTGTDYKHKNSLPLSLLPLLRQVVHARQKVLLLYNRTGQPFQKLKYYLHRALAKEYKHVTVATSSIFAENPKRFDQVIWLAPELTFSFPDFRSLEEGLVMLARLYQLLPPQREVVVVTRDYGLGDQLRRLDTEKMLREIVDERRKLFLPPFSAAVNLTAKDPIKIRQALLERFAGTPNQVRGPFNKNELLLLGNLPELVTAYSDLPVDRVDLSPREIL